MLAESRTHELSTGHRIRTPLLVPSVSSAGFKHVPLKAAEASSSPPPG